MNLSKLRTLASAAALGLLAATSAGAVAVTETIDVGTHVGPFSGNARGYWFTAPVDFWITGLDVPTEASTGNVFAAILRLTAAPPTFGSTMTDYTVLAEVRDQAAGTTDLSIAVSAGDVIGVLGYRGGVNSYGASPYNTTILGNSVTLGGFGTQNSLVASSVAGMEVWSEPAGSISRVALTVSSEAPLAAAIPLPATGLLLVGGLAGLRVARRKSPAIA